MARGFRDSRLRRDARRGPRRLPGAARGARARGRLGRVPRRRARASPTPSWPRARRRSVRRPDQHPVHLGHDRLPQGRDALAPQHPQQRLLHRRARCATTSTTASASRCRSTTCFGMVLGNLACATPRRVHGRARRVVRRRSPCSRRSRPSAAPRSTACRRCSSPSSSIRDFERFDLSSLRTGMMGGAPCPVEVMKQVRSRMHMDAGDDHLRHDRDLAGLDPDGARRPARQARRDRRPRPPARRDQDRRSRRPARSSRAATPGEQCTRGYSVMLGYWNDADGDRRRDRRRRLDAHRRPRGHGRRRLRAASSAASRT